MLGLDAHLEALMHDGGLAVVLVVAFLLGLRHATDPRPPDRNSTLVALALFAAATAVSMALVSTAFGAALSRGPASRRLESLAPAFGTLSPVPYVL